MPKVNQGIPYWSLSQTLISILWPIWVISLPLVAAILIMETSLSKGSILGSLIS